VPYRDRHTRLPWRPILCAVLFFVLAWTPGEGPRAQDAETVRRGEYIFRIAGCLSCHTDTKNRGERLAGGRALKTPFGTFYGPNITPHPTAGIGDWSDEDFVRALGEGTDPDGNHYFPVFPYPAFTGMTRADMLALKAYIFSQPPVDRPNRTHEIDFPYGWRFLNTFWKWLNFSAGTFQPDPESSEASNRGAYLVEALAHCGECHTPRGSLGGLDRTMAYAGTLEGPEGEATPNITPAPKTGIGRWSDGDLRFLLRSGLLPSGDVVGSVMGEVVDHGTSHLTDSDLEAVITYLKSLKPIENRIARKKTTSGGDDW
jgi:mono/diheme cytochrome c family protein